MKKIMFILSVSIVLTGCSAMNSEFDCPMKPCIRCESIDSINARVDRGEFGNTKPTLLPSHHLQCEAIDRSPRTGSCSYSAKGGPLRYGETVQRMWVAPFEDKEGNYHQESDIYTVVRPGHWIGTPLKETDEEE